MEPLISASLRGTYFSKIDLKSPYNQLHIKKGKEHLSAFQTPFGNYEYLVMTFSMCNSPSVFQRMISEGLYPVLGKGICVYLHDILIFTENKQKHRKR
jgi:Reverse transcriptase (RNA-dependent DNA polymerase)